MHVVEVLTTVAVHVRKRKTVAHSQDLDLAVVLDTIVLFFFLQDMFVIGTE